MRFLIGNKPPQGYDGPVYWFVYRDGQLAVHSTGRKVYVPLAAKASSIGLDVGPAYYLGLLDAVPCYGAHIQRVVNPAGIHFVTLREVFGLGNDLLFTIAGRAIQILNWESDHRYCGRCGSPTEDASDERAKLCPSCGFLAFPRITPAIIVAVMRESRILLAHARRFPPHMYSVLAGFVEPGETLEECVRREVLEEVGIVVKNIRYFGSQSWPFPHSLMVGFTAEWAEGALTVDQTENTDAGWFGRDELPLLPGPSSIARRLIDWFVSMGDKPLSANSPRMSTAIPHKQRGKRVGG